MKKIRYIILAITCFILAVNTYGQEDKVNVPDGVTYKTNFDFINKEAKEALEKELKNPTYSLFEGMLYCGPNLWDRYKSLPGTSKIEKGNIDFRISQANGDIKIRKGKLIQNIDDFKILWTQIVKDLNKTKFNIRKLNSEELKYYWSIISFDIEEPIYIAGNKNTKIIFDIYSNNIKLLFIEEINF